jgi:membrane protein DedA with SNARE-associated domain
VEALVGWLIGAVTSLDPLTIYVVVGLLAFAESAAFLGLLVPGETALLLGGILASQGRVSAVVLIAVVAPAAVAGDLTGYGIGYRWGDRLLRTRLLRRRRRALDRAGEVLARWGGPMVLFGRWVGAVRACLPALSGMARMPLRRFLPYNVLGATTWAAGCVLLGYLAGASLSRLHAITGYTSATIVALALAVAATVLVVSRRRRAGRAADRGRAPLGDGRQDRLRG